MVCASHNPLNFLSMCNKYTVQILKNKVELTTKNLLLEYIKKKIAQEIEDKLKKIKSNELEQELIKLKLEDCN